MDTGPAALLRERGIQVTAQRWAVLRAVANELHITADAVRSALSLQSVYDTLAGLVDGGLLRPDVDRAVGSAPCPEY